MDAWTAKQPETRLVEWPWAGQRELVTMSSWHWSYFDRLCRTRRCSAEDLYREISAKYPVEVTESLTWSIGHYLDVRWDHFRMERDRLANDDYAFQALRRKLREGRLPDLLQAASPGARETVRRTAPVRHRFPSIRCSPFKPIARVRAFRSEPTLRDPFRNA
jgi:hypothetical protein